MKGWLRDRRTSLDSVPHLWRLTPGAFRVKIVSQNKTKAEETRTKTETELRTREHDDLASITLISQQAMPSLTEAH